MSTTATMGRLGEAARLTLRKHELADEITVLEHALQGEIDADRPADQGRLRQRIRMLHEQWVGVCQALVELQEGA